MKTRIKSPWFWLVVALVLCFVSMIGTSCMQTNWGKNDVSVFTGTLSDVAGMIRDNNAAAGKDIQVTFTEDTASSFSFMTIIPENATADNPVPAVVCCHGGANTKEMQMPGYIELARRGFVVVTMDASGHGYTDSTISALTSNSLGMLAAVEYAMSLPCVDETQVGVTGHSMGNESCFYAIAALNTADSTQRIAAWVEGAGSNFAPQMTEEYIQGLTWTISVDKYDEFDTVYFSSYNILETDLGKSLVQKYYPEFNEAVIPEGQWYSFDGPIDSPAPGEKLPVDSAFVMYNPPITHPMFHFTNTGTAITVDGFYSAFGTPSGAEFISSDNQVWTYTVVFQVLGLIGFFMLIFPLVALLSRTKLFSRIVRKPVALEMLPSIKDPREWPLLIVTLVVLSVFSFFSYIKLYPTAGRYFDTSVYFANDVANGIGLWSLACGLFVLFVMLVSYGLKWLMYRKSNYVLSGPYASGAMSSVSQFLLTVVFAFTVVVLMFIPVYIARYVFAADFRICSLVVTAPQIDKIPVVVCKYAPLWLMFYVPNAMMNAGTKYKDMPDWLSTTICAIGNCVAVVIFIIIQYSTLYNTGALWNTSFGMAGIVAFAVAPCLFFAAFSARYIYNKTNNAWAAGMINALVMCCVTLFSTSYNFDYMLSF